MILCVQSSMGIFKSVENRCLSVNRTGKNKNGKILYRIGKTKIREKDLKDWALSQPIALLPKDSQLSFEETREMLRDLRNRIIEIENQKNDLPLKEYYKKIGAAICEGLNPFTDKIKKTSVLPEILSEPGLLKGLKKYEILHPNVLATSSAELRRNKKKKPVKFCVMCGRSLEGKRSNAETCSPACRKQRSLKNIKQKN